MKRNPINAGVQDKHDNGTKWVNLEKGIQTRQRHSIGKHWGGTPAWLDIECEKYWKGYKHDKV